MAKVHLAQLTYLSQQLFDQTKNANNLITHSKFELERIQKTLRMLLTVCSELEIMEESVLPPYKWSR